jgi:hypothetical protein
MAVADAPTGQLPRLRAGLLRELDAAEKITGSD